MKYSLCIVICCLVTHAFAQLNYRGEIEVVPGLALSSTSRTLSPSFGLGLRAHLEVDYGLEPLTFRLVLDPTAGLSDAAGQSRFEPGLTEAFALYRLNDADLSAGVERLPLETARLSVPFRVEPVNEVGQPLGLLGVRASLFLEAWRVRPAALYRYQDRQPGAVLSVRREFSSFDLEAHALYLDGFVLGLGGSGLIGDIVLYGEGWLLTKPWDGRGALGLSGFWGDSLWTGEIAYAAQALDDMGEAYPQLLTQFSLPQGEAGSWELRTSLGLKQRRSGEGNALQGQAGLSYTYSASDHQLRLGLTLTHSELATVYDAQFGLATFF